MIFVTGYYSCSGQTKIKGIQIKETFPDISTEGKLRGYDTMYVYIYYDKGNKMIRTPFFSYDYNLDTTKIFYDYFVYTNGQKDGIMYRYKDSSKRRISVDSALNTTWISKFDFYHLFTNDSVKLLSSAKGPESSLIEHYQFRGKTDTTLNGTLSLQFFKNMTGVDYSLAKPLDDARKMKLGYVKIVNNARYIPQYQWHLDRIEQEFTLKEVAAGDDIKKYFELYQKDSKVL